MNYDAFDMVLMLIVGLFIGYLVNDMRRDVKEIKEKQKRDRERKETDDRPNQTND